MKLKLDRIISIATLLAAIAAIVLVLKKPAVVVQPQAPAGAARAQGFEQKPGQTDVAQPAPASSYSSNYLPTQSQQPVSSSQALPQLKAEAHGNSDEVGNALSKMLGAAGAAGAGGLSPDANL